jgi:hypothetical protein
MTYEKLIETISEIVDNEAIETEGLTLVYSLNEKNHKQMNEHLFYKSNPSNEKFEPTDEFEVELGGIIIKFIKISEE